MKERKYNVKNTTLLEQFQNPTEKSSKEAISTPLIHKYICKSILFTLQKKKKKKKNNKTDRCPDITEILLNVALNTISLTLPLQIKGHKFKEEFLRYKIFILSVLINIFIVFSNELNENNIINKL